MKIVWLVWLRQQHNILAVAVDTLTVQFCDVPDALPDDDTDFYALDCDTDIAVRKYESIIARNHGNRPVNHRRGTDAAVFGE